MKKWAYCFFTVLLLSCNSKADKDKIMEYEISEKIWVNINGYEQGMFIKSKNIKNPVLLFLHGGPGMPEYGLTEKYPQYLDDIFTVCWWEQTGCGLSYNKNVDMGNITTEKIVMDTIEITNYLIKRFNKEKIYLMAHSYGTTIGIKAITKTPDLFFAYIAIAQVANQFESEKIAYQYMINEYINNGNKNMVKKFKKFNLLETEHITKDYYEFRDKPMHELGIGTMHNMKSVISGIFIPIMQNTNYKFSERINIWKAKTEILNKTRLMEDAFETDFSKYFTEFEIPIYFLHGLYDYTVNYNLTRDYYKIINAPLKGFYTFTESAHSPIFEEPEKINEIIIKDILLGKNENKDYEE